MPRPTKHILFTFDYELFLGKRSGSAEKCMLLPTKKLLDIFNRYGLSHAVFFVDTTYLLRLKQQGHSACLEDLRKITEQISQISREGHYVFPHLHPHWLDAVYLPESNQWDLSNTTRYSFSALGQTEKERLFAESIELLDSIRGNDDSLGYRAGGWCIQPFSDFKPFFEKHHILYDFTVMRGFHSEHPEQNFDFRKAPDRNFYRFTEDIAHEDTNGKFTEIPISSVKIGYASRILNKFLIKLLYRKGVTNYGDGHSTFSASMAEVSTHGHEMASLENLTLVNNSDYSEVIKDRNYLQFISHPKMLTPLNLACFDQLLKDVTRKYDVQTDFKKLLGIQPEKIEKKTKVLIISYVFPPYPGIGGRRWAKFAKYLDKKNIEVHVIAANNPFSETSVWNKDVKSENIQKAFIPHRYPTILEETPFSTWNRLKYRLSLHTLRKKTKGSLYDRGVFSEPDILEAASKLIEEHKIDHIICTGAPFSVLHYGVLLKKKYPPIKLMSDMRDPWTWGLAYGFRNMEPDRFAYEKKLEEEVIAESDYVTVPVQPMLDHLQTQYPLYSRKIQRLPHGIDTDELHVTQRTYTLPDPTNIKLIYSGTIYPGAETFLHHFCDSLQQKKIHSITFNIYTLSKKETLQHLFNNTPIQIHNPVPPLSLFEIIAGHDFYVSFVTGQYKDFISTKYFEIVALKKPILLIAPKGVLSDFITENALGKHFLPTEINKMVDFLVTGEKLNYNADYDLENYTYDKLSDVVITNFLLKNDKA